MQEISSTSTTSALASTIDNSESTSAAAAAAVDYNTFINLLVSEVENQDPLDPLDSSQWVTQLATYSSLEQQINSNTHLENITGLLNESLSNDSASYIGANATASALTVTDGAFPGLSIVPDAQVNTGQLVVRNASGTEVYRSETATSWVWNGTNAEGTDVADGTYSFSIEEAAGGAIISAKATGTVDRVLTTDGRQEIGFTQGVTAGDYTIL